MVAVYEQVRLQLCWGDKQAHLESNEWWGKEYCSVNDVRLVLSKWFKSYECRYLSVTEKAALGLQ